MSQQNIQPVYNPAPPTAAATTTNVDTSPSASIQQILAAFQPQATQSNMNLQNALAASGVTGGANIDATNNLQGTLASSLGPSLASAIENAQGLSLNQAQGNAASTNNATNFNVANAINTQTGNTATANNFEQFLASLQNGDWQSLLSQFGSLNSQGLSGAQGINANSANNYGIQSGAGSAFSGLGSALGNLTAPSSAPATPATPTPVDTPGAGAITYG